MKNIICSSNILTEDIWQWSIYNNVTDQDEICRATEKVENQRMEYSTAWTGILSTPELPEVTWSKFSGFSIERYFISDKTLFTKSEFNLTNIAIRCTIFRYQIDGRRSGWQRRCAHERVWRWRTRHVGRICLSISYKSNHRGRQRSIITAASSSFRIIVILSSVRLVIPRKLNDSWINAW